jgi:hypothetical protein
MENQKFKRLDRYIGRVSPHSAIVHHSNIVCSNCSQKETHKNHEDSDSSLRLTNSKSTSVFVEPHLEEANFRWGFTPMRNITFLLLLGVLLRF